MKLPVAPLIAFCLLLVGDRSSAAPAQIQSGNKIITPSKEQVRQLTLDLQIASLKCDQQMKVLAQQVFDSAVSFRLRTRHFPKSASQLQRSSSSGTTESAIPPSNPFTDPKLVSKELRQELVNAGSPPSPFCRIVLESDPYISAGFPLTLKNVKLKPDQSEPGAIIVKFNGDAYLAVWCMGLSGKTIRDEKTQLPFVLFKDFSTLLE